jgi:hypothetical protein
MVYYLLLWLLTGKGLLWFITCYYGYILFRAYYGLLLVIMVTYWLGPIMVYYLLLWLLSG